MRTLDAGLDVIMLSAQRSPRWRVDVYDIRSSVADTIGSIVKEDALETVTGPRDFTSDTISVQINESSGNFVDGGIPATRVVLTISDPHSLFDYFNLIADPTGDGRWIRRSNVLRIREGDADVDPSDWPITFTGVFVGQPGVDNNRTSGTSVITIEAVGRETQFITSKVTSQTFGAGVSYLSVADTIARTDMGLDIDEILLSGWGSQLMGHKVTQFVDQEPMVSLAQLMMIDGFMPKFNGEGKLTQIQALSTATPVRAYTNDNIIRSVVQPSSNENPVNQVCIVGLDKDMTNVPQDKQEIGRVTMTVGYFSNNQVVKVYWSTDRTKLASNVKFIIEQGINGGLSAFGSEEFEEIVSPDGLEGTIGGVITVGTGFAPYIIAIIAVAYIASSYLPDFVEVVGLFINFGITIPFGSVIQAILLSAALIIMAQIGRAVYRIDGEPFEYVFLEIRECAEIDDLLSGDIVGAVVENHLVNTSADAKALGRDILFRQQARGRPRTISMLTDLRLEPDDTIQLANARRYLIDTMTRTLARASDNVVSSITGFEVTPGIGAVV